MIRQRIAALAVAGTVAFGATAIHTPTATAEPERPAAEITQLSSGAGTDKLKEAFGAIFGIPLGLSSLLFAQFAPREYVCDGLVPRFCTKEELEHRRTAPRV